MISLRETGREEFSMAYQPFPSAAPGHLSEFSNMATPVTLAAAGTEYVVISVRVALPAPTNDYSIPLEALSVLATANKDIEYRIIIGGTVSGDPLVYSQLDPVSVLEGAVGNGTQTVSGFITAATGGYVPASNERALGKTVTQSNDVPLIAIPGLAFCLVAMGLANNAAVAARGEFREIKLDAAGNPIA